MSFEHKNALKLHRIELLKELVIDERLLSYLCFHEILTDDMKERIQNTIGIYAQIGKLLDFLPRRGPHAFQIFINALCFTNQDHLACRLEGPQQQQSQAQSFMTSLRSRTPPPSYESIMMQHPFGPAASFPQPHMVVQAEQSPPPASLAPTAPPEDTVTLQKPPPGVPLSTAAHVKFIPRRPAPPPPKPQTPLQTYAVASGDSMNNR